jgi:hypothetical protein
VQAWNNKTSSVYLHALDYCLQTYTDI